MKTTIELLRERRVLKEILSNFSTRELFRDYRQTVKYYNEVITHYNTGSEWHLGEPMRRVVADAKWSLNACLEELIKRNLKPEKITNVEPLVVKLTQTQIENNAAQKVQEREIRDANYKIALLQETEKPLIAAMNKLCVFALNYNNNFIEEAFAETGLTAHFKSKFLGYHEKATPYGALIAFWSALDIENRNTLMRYILNSEIK